MQKRTELRGSLASRAVTQGEESLFGFHFGGDHKETMTDDASLLRSYAEERTETAFAELVRRHLDGVYSAALRRLGGDRHLAEDVSQQVFAALAGQAERLADRAELTGWLYTTTRNVAANVVRGERRRKSREQEATLMNEILAPATNEADWSRVAPVLDEAIDALAENDRAAILARFIDRRAFGEIGATLRISEDAARMRVERALEKLRALLERRGIGSTSAALGIALANHAVVAAPVGLAASVGAGAVSAAVAGGAMLFMGTSLTKIAAVAGAVILGTAAVFVSLQKNRAISPGANGDLRAQIERQAATNLGTKPLRLPEVSQTPPSTLAESGSVDPNYKISGVVLAMIEGLPSKPTNKEAHIIDLAYSDAVRDREALELSLAQREDVEPGVVLITIPEYHKEGIEILRRYAYRLAAEIGGNRGKQIAMEFELPLRKGNRDFGNKEQQILIEDKGTNYRIVHGSGFAMKINGALSIGAKTTQSNLRPQDVDAGIYGYLKPLFPAKKVSPK